ncbi:hypothetical protein GCM10025734_58580 [Kitasatospora paranensis]
MDPRLPSDRTEVSAIRSSGGGRDALSVGAGQRSPGRDSRVGGPSGGDRRHDPVGDGLVHAHRAATGCGGPEVARITERPCSGGHRLAAPPDRPAERRRAAREIVADGPRVDLDRRSAMALLPHSLTRSRPLTTTGSPLFTELTRLVASHRQATTVIQVVSPSTQSPAPRSNRRSVVAILKFATGTPPAVCA